MVSGTEEGLEESGSAMKASRSQLQQAGQSEASEDYPCPICLGDVNNVAYVDVCFYRFCYCCIRQWAAMRVACSLCRQAFNCVLHMVRADNDYEEFIVESPTYRRNVDRERS